MKTNHNLKLKMILNKEVLGKYSICNKDKKFLLNCFMKFLKT